MNHFLFNICPQKLRETNSNYLLFFQSWNLFFLNFSSFLWKIPCSVQRTTVWHPRRFLCQDLARMSRGEVSESSLSGNRTLFADHNFPIFMCAGATLSLCGKIFTGELQFFQPSNHSLPPVHYWQRCWNKGLAAQQHQINARHLPSQVAVKNKCSSVAFALISWTLKESLVPLQHQLSSHSWVPPWAAAAAPSQGRIWGAQRDVGQGPRAHRHSQQHSVPMEAPRGGASPWAREGSWRTGGAWDAPIHSWRGRSPAEEGKDNQLCSHFQLVGCSTALPSPHHFYKSSGSSDCVPSKISISPPCISHTQEKKDKFFIILPSGFSLTHYFTLLPSHFCCLSASQVRFIQDCWAGIFLLQCSHRPC